MKCEKLIFIFALTYLLLALAIPGYCNEKPTCLVLIFYPDEASSEQLEGRYITNKFAQILDRLDIYDVIDRTELTQRITDEKYWKIVETCKDNECAIEAGRLVNVRISLKYHRAVRCANRTWGRLCGLEANRTK
ncbi:MAG: hypothetical protein ACKVE4_05190 [Dissulfuribacterales bacterium]